MQKTDNNCIQEIHNSVSGPIYALKINECDKT